jgi:repressor LexA
MSRDKQPLTPKEKMILNFIEEYQAQTDTSPTYSEIQDKFEYKAISSVQQYVAQLVDKGHLRAPLGKSKKRALELVPDEDETDLVTIPMEGYVAAGLLTEAIQNRELIEVAPSLLGKQGSKQDYFGLTVRGDSMIDACILDGDLVIIRRQSTARNGQTVVAMVDEEATLKTYFKKVTHIELHPANPNYAVIHIPKTANFRILGVVSSVIRKMDQ